MANPLDTDAGSELFSSYEADLRLLQADLNQKLDQIAELTGEERKGAIRLAERAVDEANELVSLTTLGNLQALNLNVSSIKCAWRRKTSRLHPDPGSMLGSAISLQTLIP